MSPNRGLCSLWKLQGLPPEKAELRGTDRLSPGTFTFNSYRQGPTNSPFHGRQYVSASATRRALRHSLACNSHWRILLCFQDLSRPLLQPNPKRSQIAEEPFSPRGLSHLHGFCRGGPHHLLSASAPGDLLAPCGWGMIHTWPLTQFSPLENHREGRWGDNSTSFPLTGLHTGAHLARGLLEYHWRRLEMDGRPGCQVKHRTPC